ncbi:MULTISPECIES: hypothetical protein [Nonomuraea]|uniref:Lipoprotein n=2 Tax=Nonomuraea TaxID=83681 RepID=A0A7W5VFK7_9ACTN|nr:hypothetical protein [Nonomuraea dietziae]MBB3731218.1 hypothetical protein [Nonomuraea dietziae]
MRFLKRAITISAATLTLTGLTACGAVGNAANCVEANNEATKIMTEYSKGMTNIGTNPDEMQKAMAKSAQEASDKLKTLAGKYDGELAEALNEAAGLFESLKSDATSADAMTKVQSFSTKIQSACS